MKRMTLALAGAGLLAMVAVGFFLVTARPSQVGELETTLSSPVETTLAEMAARNTELADQRPLAGAVRQELPSRDEERSVACRVLRGWDQPFPGARVRATVFDGFSTDGKPESTSLLVADETGLVILRRPKSDRSQTIRFSSGDDRATGPPESILAVPGDAGTPTATLRLFPLDHEIFGQVHDENGAPVANARIACFLTDEPVKSGPEGRFQMQVSSASPEVRYSVSADGSQLTVEYTVTDSAYLTEPFNGTVTWHRMPDDAPIYEFNCDAEIAKRSTLNAAPVGR